MINLSGVGGFNPSSGASQAPKFVLTPEKIVKISQKYIADPPLVFPQIEYCTLVSHGIILPSSFWNCVFTTAKFNASANSNNISPSTFYLHNPYRPWTPSKPTTSTPTCPFISPQINNFSPSSISNTTFPNKEKNSSFSTLPLPDWGAYTDIKFSADLPRITLHALFLYFQHWTPSIFSIHFSATSSLNPWIPFP